MDILTIFSILISLSAVFSFINYLYFHLPRTIGLMLFALVLSILLIIIGHTGWDVRDQAAGIIQRIDFNRFLLQGMLGFLLFAGALHVEANELMQHKWIIFLLATAGTIFSTALIGVLVWLVLHFMDPALPLIYCLLFGALISPTDPVTSSSQPPANPIQSPRAVPKITATRVPSPALARMLPAPRMTRLKTSRPR